VGREATAKNSGLNTFVSVQITNCNLGTFSGQR